MPTPSPTYGWDLPTLSEVADGPAAFTALAVDIEATLASTAYQTYLPSWTSAGAAQPANLVTRSGQYRLDHGICSFAAQLFFGGSTTGGQGALGVGLPVPATGGIIEQIVHAVLFTPNTGGKWNGIGQILGSGDTSKVYPYFPAVTERCETFQWQSADSTGFPATGVPNLQNGTWNVQNGGNVIVFGRYFAA